MKKIFRKYKGKLFTPLQINVKIGTIMNGILTKYKLPKITQEEDIRKKSRMENVIKNCLQKYSRHRKYRNQLISFKKHSRESLIGMLYKLCLKTEEKIKG